MKRWLVFCVWNVLANFGYALDSKIVALTYDPMHHYIYLGHLSATQIDYCAINQLKTQNACRSTGPTYFIRPISLAMHPRGQYLYVVDDIYRFIAKCTIQTETGQLQDCQEIPFSQSNPLSVAIHPQKNRIYIVHTSGISFCDLDEDGNFENCDRVASNNKNIISISLNQGGTQAYLLSSNAIKMCTIGTGVKEIWHQCQTFYFNKLQKHPHTMMASNIYSGPKNLNHELFRSSFAIDESGVLSFINHYPDGSEFRCNISQNTANYRICFSGGNAQGYSAPLSMQINYDNSRMYILSAGLVKLICTINSIGHLSQCIPTLQELHIPLKDVMP